MKFINLILFLLAGHLTMGIAEDTILYTSETRNVITESTWNVEKKEGAIVVQGKDGASHIEIDYSADYALLHYSEKEGAGREFSVTKQGPCLIITQNNKGKQKMKSYKLGSSPWVQEFKFGLRPLLLGQERKFAFTIVDPDSLDVHDLIASKEEEETLEVDTHSYNTQKVKITLQGFKKRFWTAYVWFDKETNQLVKYRANKGPGTPYTEVLLVEQKKG